MVRNGILLSITVGRRCLLAGWVALWLGCMMPLRGQIHTDNVLLMGRSALASDDYLTAIHYFTQVVEARPYLHQPYYYRAYAKFCLDDYVGAEDDCSQSIARNAYQVEVFQLRGLCRIRLGNLSGAIDDYTRTLRELPDDQSARYNRALCYLQSQQPEEAAADVEKLLQRYPQFYRAYALRAQVCLEQGDTAQAMVWIDGLLQRHSDDADSWAFKGRYALSRQEYHTADSLLTRAIRLQPQVYNYYVARALARHGMNRFGEAIADYDQCISLVPQHFVAHYNRGLLLALVGESNRAIDDFSFVIEQEPDNILAIYNRALLRQQTADYRGAVADFSRIIREYPHFLYGYAARAECRRKMGDLRGALRDESVIARANLDLTFQQQRRRPIKAVRRITDHNLDDYDRLVSDDDRDSTGSAMGRLLASDLFGRVQDKQVERRPLSLFRLTFKPMEEGRGSAPLTYMAELTALSTAAAAAGEPTPRWATAEGSGVAYIGTTVPTTTTAEGCLLTAVRATDTYDYAAALAALEQAAGAGPSRDMQLLIVLQRAAVKYYQAMASSGQMADGGHATESVALSLLSEAMVALQAAERLAPENAYVAYNIGCVWRAQGSPQQALEAFTKALQCDPRLAEAALGRGWVHLDMGHSREARSDWSRAGELGLYKAYALIKQVIPKN